MEYNDEKFEYDAIGNPTTYRDKKLVWSHGRQLDKFGDIATFTYDINGLRTSKYANGFTTKFYLNGNKIIAQKDAINKMYFFYGADGVTDFELNGVNYFYKKNAQNDVISSMTYLSKCFNYNKQKRPSLTSVFLIYQFNFKHL